MASKLHPDKKSLIYGEWSAVLDVLRLQAEAETEERQAKAGPNERVTPVTVPEIIRRATLEKANKVLKANGLEPLALDPSASPVAHRGDRFDSKSGSLRPAASKPDRVDELTMLRQQLAELQSRVGSVLGKAKPRRRTTAQK